NGLVSYNRILRSRYELEASEGALGILRNDITLNVLHNYLQVLLSKELITIAAAQLAATREQEVHTSAMVNAGRLTQGSLLDIEAQAAREELHLVSMQNQHRISLLSLAHLLNLDTAGGFDISAPPEDTAGEATLPPDAESVYTAALQWWPALKKAEAMVDIAGSDLKIAKGQQSPKLMVSSAFSTGFADTRRRLLNNDPANPVYGFYPPADQLTDNIRYGVGFNLSVPVLNGWQTRTGIRNSGLELMKQELAAVEARKELLREISLISADAQAALKRRDAAGRSAAAAREAFSYAGQRFRAGDMTSSEYSTVKTFLLAAESELLQAEFQYIFSVKMLGFYSGSMQPGATVMKR
ncbi:MAG: TolC family protein, partial [Bacteroidetes bacterium]|nr:TolC family protein [Bacteroidota bacterium]